MRSVNRCAVVVRPLQPFVDWVRKVDREMGAHMPEEEIAAWSRVFLTPLFYVSEDIEEYLESNACEVFEAMLRGWSPHPEMWPEERGWEAFQAWLSYEIPTMIYDMPEAALQRGELEGQDREFGFWQSLLNDYQDGVHPVLSQVWADGLFREFGASPEAQTLEGGLGGAREVVDELHVFLNEPFHLIDAELLEEAIFGVCGRQGFASELDGASIVAELQALFAFAKRAYSFPPADACLQILARKGLARELDNALVKKKHKTSRAKVSTKVMEQGAQAAVYTPFIVQKPFVAKDTEVGRNDPCPCGSGKKYKRCCLTVS